jgi:hypothetical protein
MDYGPMGRVVPSEGARVTKPVACVPQRDEMD